MHSSVLLKRGLLLFWSVWLSVVFASNLADALQQIGLLPATTPFVSGNYAMIRETVGIYSITSSLAPVLFAGVLFVQLAASFLFWRAFLDRESVQTVGHPKVLQAFTVTIALFAGFLFADEAFIVYHHFKGMETTHFLILCALLLSLVVISQLSDRSRAI